MRRRDIWGGYNRPGYSKGALGFCCQWVCGFDDCSNLTQKSFLKWKGTFTDLFETFGRHQLHYIWHWLSNCLTYWLKVKNEAFYATNDWMRLSSLHTRHFLLQIFNLLANLCGGYKLSVSINYDLPYHVCNSGHLCWYLWPPVDSDHSPIDILYLSKFFKINV